MGKLAYGHGTVAATLTTLCHAMRCATIAKLDMRAIAENAPTQLVKYMQKQKRVGTIMLCAQKSAGIQCADVKPGEGSCVES